MGFTCHCLSQAFRPEEFLKAGLSPAASPFQLRRKINISKVQKRVGQAAPGLAEANKELLLLGHLVSAKELSQGLQVSSEETNILISCYDREELKYTTVPPVSSYLGQGSKPCLD